MPTIFGRAAIIVARQVASSYVVHASKQGDLILLFCSIGVCELTESSRYCSPACQKKRWPVHKDKCKLAQNEQKEQVLKEQKLKGQELNGKPPEEPNEKANEAKPTKRIDIIVWQGKGDKKVPREATPEEQEEVELAIKEDEKREPLKKDQTFQL